MSSVVEGSIAHVLDGRLWVAIDGMTYDGMTYDETITLPTIAVEFDTLGALNLGAKPTNVRLTNRTDTRF